MGFKISDELIRSVQSSIESKNDKELEFLLQDVHHADIAEILEELDFNEAI